jgi:hypothetical protein
MRNLMFAAAPQRAALGLGAALALGLTSVLAAAPLAAQGLNSSAETSAADLAKPVMTAPDALLEAALPQSDARPSYSGPSETPNDPASAVPAETAAAPLSADALQSVTRQLSDPARQEQLAMTLSTLSQVMLDLPLAPILEPLGDVAADMGAERVPEVERDATLRTLAPRASEIPEQIERQLPQAMDRLAGMSEGLAALLPALAAMGEQLREALPSRLSAPQAGRE